MTDTNSSAPLTLSAAAAKRINAIVKAENKPELMVRLEVLGGGCSGYQYRFGFEAAFSAHEDVIIERDGARLVVDKTSLELLQGSEIDYAESLMEAGFKVNNPHATASCGCGSSFSV
ncbi:MAG: iron-sulfur cluster insertion protein ErpA [Alphaproteobacteria bacterium]|nr:iron-sulfur cluster insertion protein ErpA [Alphaproteobacteria bacterium]MBV8549121.1 iron-sulfur cluster insertion protein ErpA [Alphaproteobacteria bacterium]